MDTRPVVICCALLCWSNACFVLRFTQQLQSSKLLGAMKALVAVTSRSPGEQLISVGSSGGTIKITIPGNLESRPRIQRLPRYSQCRPPLIPGAVDKGLALEPGLPIRTRKRTVDCSDDAQVRPPTVGRDLDLEVTPRSPRPGTDKNLHDITLFPEPRRSSLRERFWRVGDDLQLPVPAAKDRKEIQVVPETADRCG